MEKEFVPYEHALELKEIEFNEPCFGLYAPPCKTVFLHHYGLLSAKEQILAPTFSQAFRWFRDKGYDVKISKENPGLYFGFYWTGAAWIIVGNGTYEESELACLIKLIELVKSK